MADRSGVIAATMSSNACGKVSAGLLTPAPFFLKGEPRFRNKPMRDHDQQHMAVPADVGTGFVIRHAEEAFALLKALFDGPAQRGRLMQFADGDRGGRVAQGVLDPAIFVFAEVEPHLVAVAALLPLDHAAACDPRPDRPLRPFHQHNVLPRQRLVSGDGGDRNGGNGRERFGRGSAPFAGALGNVPCRSFPEHVLVAVNVRNPPYGRR